MSLWKCTGKFLFSMTGKKLHPPSQNALLKSQLRAGVECEHLDSNNVIILSWQNEMTPNVVDPGRIQWSEGCAKLADTTYYIVLQLWHRGKWGIWWGALEQWLEWQNAPKAPASSNEAAWCSNQVHWAQEGPAVARTLAQSFQQSCIHRSAHLLLPSTVNI